MKLLKENLNISTHLRKFLKEPHIVQALDDYNFEYIYNKLNEADGDTATFTELLYNLNVDPLNYLKHIPASFMAEASTIKHANIPANIESIGNAAFFDCDRLTSIDLSKCTNLTIIDNFAFSRCYNLTNIDLSNCTNLTSIGDYAFSCCLKLASIDLSDCTSLTRINQLAFSSCIRLTSITIPASVTSIGSSAFDGCTALQKITIPEKFRRLVKWRLGIPEDCEIEYY